MAKMWFAYEMKKDLPDGSFQMIFTSKPDFSKKDVKFVKGITLGGGKMLFVNDPPPKASAKKRK